MVSIEESRKFVYLKPGFRNQNLVFAKPGKNLFRDKKVEWVIEAPGDHARVQYALEGQRLTRKFVIGEEASDEKEAGLIPCLRSRPARFHCMSAWMGGM